MPGSGHNLLDVITDIQELFEKISEQNPELSKLKIDIDDELYEVLVSNEIVLTQETKDIIQGLIKVFWGPARKRLHDELNI